MRKDIAEKLFEWSIDKIHWYADAETCPLNNRNAILAKTILDKLPPQPSICEFGCGIGGLSMELSKSALHVTSVDSCGWALNFMFETLLARNIKNVNIIQGDFTVEPPPREKADAVVMCMVGSLERHLSSAQSWAKSKIFFITETPASPGFGLRPKRPGRPGPDSIRRYLDSAGCNYCEDTVFTSAGQPFKSYEEAQKFCRAYNPQMSAEVISEYLDKRLRPNDDRQFPLYLPRDSEYAVFSIDAQVKAPTSNKQETL